MSKKDKPAPFASLDAFRDAARASCGTQIEDAHIRASFDTEVKEKDGSDGRTLLFTISTASVDRMGDTIKLDGWELDNYRKNPVVLFGHDASAPPIAKAPRVWTEDGALKAEAQFVPADNPAIGRFAEGILQLYKGGFMSATSVGFSPKQYAFTEDPSRRFGIDFLKQELLEYSAVPVPANAEALIEGRAAGIDVTGMLDFYEDQIRRAAGADRLIKLAESVLGKDGKDTVAVSWAKGIMSGAGFKLLDPAEVAAQDAEKARVQRAATAERLRQKRIRDARLLALGGPQ